MGIGEYKSFKDDKSLKVSCDIRQAEMIQKFICKKMNWPIFKIVFTGQAYKRLNARFYPCEEKIVFHVNGQRVCTVLHELAHHVGVKYKHNIVFKNTLYQITQLYKKNEKKIFKGYKIPNKVHERVKPEPNTKTKKIRIVKMVKPIKVIERPTFVFSKVKKEIINDIMAEVVNKTLHIKHVGRVLVDYGLNNIGNLKTIELAIQKKGVNIVRG